MIFFFKQKTAYELRISDWSSDVCSSDLFDRIEIEGATFETIVSRAAVEGLQCSGYDSNPSQRPELQGAPKFKGVCGPMWDGDAIRYECSATYAELSA